MLSSVIGRGSGILISDGVSFKEGCPAIISPPGEMFSVVSSSGYVTGTAMARRATEAAMAASLVKNIILSFLLSLTA
jgi:hypothetical protein